MCWPGKLDTAYTDTINHAQPGLNRSHRATVRNFVCRTSALGDDRNAHNHICFASCVVALGAK